jgi:hypothetical protein
MLYGMSAHRSLQLVLYLWNAPARVDIDRLRVLLAAHHNILPRGGWGSERILGQFEGQEYESTCPMCGACRGLRHPGRANASPSDIARVEAIAREERIIYPPVETTVLVRPALIVGWINVASNKYLQVFTGEGLPHPAVCVRIKPHIRH